MSADKDEDYDGNWNAVLKALADVHETWSAFQAQISGEITEYKKTVNNAISLLATESLKHQTDTSKRLADDAIERRERQIVVDTATANVRSDMMQARAETLQRLDASAATVREDMLAARAESVAHAEVHERRANRKSYMIFSSIGCLVLVNVIALIVLAALLVSLYWK